MAIPTKDRSKMVAEVLNYELGYYKEFNLSLCYYDSSSDNKTKEAVVSASKKYDVDVLYKKIDEELCLDYKIVEIIKDFLYLDYDYFWLINDSVSISEEMLRYINNIIDNEYDLIRLPLSGAGKISDYITNDINDWFCNCSQGMAHMASTIMSKNLINMDIDWEFLTHKYIYNNSLDDEHGYFFTVAFYLEQIYRLKYFKGLFIGNRYQWRRDSPLKKNQIYWSKYVFEAWAKSYPETILKLPDIYTNKEDVIKKSDNIGPGRFSKEMLIHYRLNGLYDEAKFEKYKKYFKYVSDVSAEECMEIARIPVDKLRTDYANLISVEEQWDFKLEQIERNIINQSIYLYGAGLYGEKVALKLKEDGYGVYIKGILVTNTQDNVKYLCDKKVISVDEAILDDGSLIIICTLPGIASGIKVELNKRNISNYIGLFDV